MRENSGRSSSDQRVLVFGIAIFICVFMGPFDTADDLSFWDRLVFWTVAVISVGLIVEKCMIAVIDSRLFKRWHIFFKLLLGAMVGAVPGTSFIITINMLFRPEHLDDMTFPVFWAQVTIMALLIAGLEHLIWVRFHAPALATQDLVPTDLEARETSDGESADIVALDNMSMPRLYQRLPSHLREGQIVSMSMQDHYVEVTTTLGNEMILMRLSDAIDLLDGMSGAQTHRSHWVARGHAMGLSRVARRHELTLSDGRSLPVSNSYKDAVERMLDKKRQA